MSVLITTTNIIKLPSSEFIWERWRAGSYYHLGFFNGHFDIKTDFGKIIIRKYAIGYCDAKKISVRPRNDSMAVMFFKNGETFWSHLRYEEFNNIF